MFNNLKIIPKKLKKKYFLYSLSFGISGEPPLFDSLALLKNLANAPKRGKCNNTQQYRHDFRVDNHGGYAKDDTCKQKEPPTFNAQVVFGLYYKWMKESYYKKRDKAEVKAV